jgi:hypothetical protein
LNKLADLKGFCRRDSGKGAMEGAGRQKPRPGAKKQDVFERRANPRGGALKSLSVRIGFLFE